MCSARERRALLDDCPSLAPGRLQAGPANFNPRPDSFRIGAQRCSITLIRNLSSGIGFGLNFSRKL